MPINLKQLHNFLIDARKAGYASGHKARKCKEKDQSTTILFKKGYWQYNDNYFGGEPYGGREVVFYKHSPVFIAVYYGYVNSIVSDFKACYKFLQEALQRGKQPLRGPKMYKGGEYTYLNKLKGTIVKFSGTEMITFKNKQIYEAYFTGGLVDQRKE